MRLSRLDLTVATAAVIIILTVAASLVLIMLAGCATPRLRPFGPIAVSIAGRLGLTDSATS